jgi:hypothetical protein
MRFRKDFSSHTQLSHQTDLSTRQLDSQSIAAQAIKNLIAIEVEHEKADRRRQVGVLAIGVDPSNEIGQRHLTNSGNLLQRIPELILKTDTGFMPANDDRAFSDRRFHGMSPHAARNTGRRSNALGELWFHQIANNPHDLPSRRSILFNPGVLKPGIGQLVTWYLHGQIAGYA